MVAREYKINLPKDVEFVLKTLHQHSKSSYLVGGCIRDILLGFKPKDWDFCTDIEYNKLLDIFKDYSPKEIGAHFGIIQIKINDEHYEIAKFRKDIGLSEDRRQQKIEFTSSLEDDLKRRDFKINAICYDGEKLITLSEEHFDDIENRELNFIGDFRERLIEDPLRIFRFVRFLVTKNLYGSTSSIFYYRSWVVENIDIVRRLSKERIRDEFVKILLSDNPTVGLRELNNYGLLELIIPNIKDTELDQKNPHHNSNVRQHIFRVIRACEPILELRLSALLHDIGKPSCFTMDENGVGHFYGHEKVSEEMAREILTNLKFDNKTIDIVCKLVGNHMNKSHRQTPKAVRKLINRVGMGNMLLLFKLLEADIIGSKPPYNFELLDTLKILFHEIKNENKESPCLEIRDLAINGYDLIRLGYVGKNIGDKLKELHELVLENGSKFNNYENLLKYC